MIVIYVLTQLFFLSINVIPRHSVAGEEKLPVAYLVHVSSHILVLKVSVVRL
jgi:hypothetical protein